jgi:hypothetical protein
VLKTFLPSIILAVLLASTAFAQSGTPMSAEEMAELVGGGATLQLGGAGMGYKGELVLTADGKGKGGATTDAGDKISISGTWKLKKGKFCRKWKGMDGGKEVCETWVKKSDRSVEVYNGDQMMGVNSW